MLTSPIAVLCREFANNDCPVIGAKTTLCSRPINNVSHLSDTCNIKNETQAVTQNDPFLMLVQKGKRRHNINEPWNVMRIR